MYRAFFSIGSGNFATLLITSEHDDGVAENVMIHERGTAMEYMEEFTQELKTRGVSRVIPCSGEELTLITLDAAVRTCREHDSKSVGSECT